MSLGHIRRLSSLGIIMTGLLVTGCVMRDPQALTDLNQARDAILASRQAGAAQRFPDDFAALKTRFLEARGTFYACQDAKASEMARALVDDANKLATKRVEAPAPAPKPIPKPPPANQPPLAHMQFPSAGDSNALLTFYATGSSDPDEDKLTYRWDFGDGKSSGFTFPVATHRYAKAGNYTVQLTVDDGRGGSDTTMARITVVSRQVIRGDVLFDSDSVKLKPAAEHALVGIITQMQDDPTLRAEIVGHTDSAGAAAYNLRLSQRRAVAARDYLIARGISPTRLKLDWKGEAQPLASNETRDGRAKNRRVEITLRPLPVQ